MQMVIQSLIASLSIGFVIRNVLSEAPVNLSGVQGLALEEFVSGGVRIYSSVTVSALNHILTGKCKSVIGKEYFSQPFLAILG